MTIDTALENGRTSELVLLALLILSISLLRGGFAYGQSYLAEWISQRVAYDLRHALLARLHTLSFGFHDREKTGDMMSRATTDVESIRWFVSFGLIYGLHVFVLVGAVSGLLLVTDWDLALVSLAVIPVALYIGVRMSRRFRGLWRDVQAETGRMTTVLQENLSGMHVVKTFGAEEHEKAKFRETAQVVSEKTFIVNRLHAANSSLLNLLFVLATALVIWFGGWQIINTDSGVTSRRAYPVYPIPGPSGLSRPHGRMGRQPLREGYSRRGAHLLRPGRPVAGGGEGRGHRPRQYQGRGKAGKGVSFSYGPPGADNTPPPTPALRHVDLVAYPGQKIALLGAPGSGKSTIVNLIPRFYDVTQGRVTIDGLDVRDVTLESLRNSVGIVFQDVFIFMATIRENISYGVAGSALREDRGGGPLGPHPRLRHGPSRPVRNPGRRAGSHAVLRTASAPRHSPYAATRPACAHTGRLDLQRGR